MTLAGLGGSERLLEEGVWVLPEVHRGLVRRRVGPRDLVDDIVSVAVPPGSRGGRTVGCVGGNGIPDDRLPRTGGVERSLV